MKSTEHLENVQKFHDMDAEQYRKARYQNDNCEGLAYLSRQKTELSLLDGLSGKICVCGGAQKNSQPGHFFRFAIAP